MECTTHLETMCDSWVRRASVDVVPSKRRIDACQAFLLPAAKAIIKYFEVNRDFLMKQA